MKKFTPFKIDEKVSANDILLNVFKDEFLFRDFNSPTELKTCGFDKYNEHQDYLLVNNILAIKYKSKEKIIPSNYVNEKLKEKVNQIFKTEFRIVGKKEKTILKQEIIDALLPKAFDKTNYNDIVFDFNNHIMYFDSTSNKLNDEIIGILIRANEGLELNPEPITPTLPFGSTMRDRIINGWFDSDDNDTGLYTSNKCSIEFSYGDDIAQIDFKNLDMYSDDVQVQIQKTERFVSKITFNLDDDIVFTVNDKISFTAVKNNLVKNKFNPNEETIQEFNNSNLIIVTSGLLQIVNSVLSTLE